MRTTFINTLCEMAEKDKRIWLLCADLGFSVLENFANRFSDRFVNVGVAEQNMAGLAAGLAMSNKLVFTYSMANFSTLRCLEQIRNDICYHNLPVKIVAVGGGFWYGAQGYTHHGIEDLAIISSLPNMVVAAPADSIEMRLVIYSVASDPRPCYIRLERCNEFVVHKKNPDFKIGKAIRLREGKDILLISTGCLLKEAIQAADIVKQNNISVGVWSMPFVKPIDRDAIIDSAKRYKFIITIEEGQIKGGLSSAVAQILAQMNSARATLLPLGISDNIFCNSYNHVSARKKAGLDACSLANRILDLYKLV